jgi:hypothetical protein
MFSIELCSFFALFCKFWSFVFHLIMLFLFSCEFPYFQCVPLNYALLLFTWFFKFISGVFNLIIFLFFALFCKFRSFVFHLIMPFLFSLEFPNVQCVPLNYAIMFLASFFKLRLYVFHWIIPFPFHLLYFVYSTELCPSVVNKVGPLHSLRQSTKL